jgi:hypothetical protein
MFDDLSADELSTVIVGGCLAMIVGAVLIAFGWVTF